MRKSRRGPDILQTGGFSLHHYAGRLFKIGFVGQCCVIAALVAIAMLTASVIDHSLILDGQNIGLLEHPALWGFPLLQIVIPLCIRQSLQKLQRAHLRNGEIAEVEGNLSPLIAPVRMFLSLQGKGSRFAATVIYCIGLAAFVWNTYQNQKPGIIVPYDFWDSKNYLWGFWITRVYKLYLFGWLLPYIAMIQVAILVVILRVVRRARLSGKLKLLPFHPDRVGGLGFVASLISTPIIVTLVVGSLATATAFLIHRGADVTPLMALTILVTWGLVAYFVPIFFLRSDIAAIKREALEKLRGLQQENYSQIIKSHGHDVEMLGKGKEALDYFDKVCKDIQAISNYPHLKRLLSFSGLSMVPSIIPLAIKAYQSLAPLIGPLLKPH